MVNYDYQQVNITKLPPGYTPASLKEELRKNFHTFFEGVKFNSTMSVVEESEVSWNSKNPLGSVVVFYGFDYGKNGSTSMVQGVVRDAVIASQNEELYWIFTPVETSDDYTHLLAGHRQFGIGIGSDGSLTFYTRGIDTVYPVMHTLFFNGGDWFFGRANEMWAEVYENASKFINSLGGESQFSHSFGMQTDIPTLKKMESKVLENDL